MLPPKNYHVLFGKSTLGVFYKIIGRIKEAHNLLQDVVDSLGLNIIIFYLLKTTKGKVYDVPYHSKIKQKMLIIFDLYRL